MAQHWRIELFGGLRLRRGDQVITRFRTHKTGALLAYLAYYPGLSNKETLLAQLWPEASESTARNNMRLALSALRRQLSVPGDNPDPILTDRNTVALRPNTFSTDVAEFESTLRAAVEHPSTSLEQWRRAVDLYQGPLLAGYYESWVPVEAVRQEALFLTAVEQLVAELERGGEWQLALQYATRGLQSDATHQTLSEAVRRLRRQEKRARRTASEHPVATEETEPATHTIASSPSKVASRLPIPLARFFGREAELATLSEWQGDAETRLISLTGPGGIGKTHMALEAARRATGDNLPAYFVALSGLPNATLLPDTVLDALPATRTAAPVLDQIEAALPGPALLILDNFEPFALSGRALLLSLLDRLPSLTLLVTSRHRLDIAGERVLEVPPFPVPSAESGAHGLDGFAAARMLLDRARAVRPDFAISPRNAVTIARLLAQLDGLPLAIELAAARLAVLSPLRLLELLVGHSAPLDALEARRRELPSRHQSLRAAFAASFGLLPTEAQHFFAALALFRGGFDATAARAVTEDSYTLHHIAQLRGASLLTDAPSAAHEARFRLLEPLREFAEEQLLPETRHELAARHGRHFSEVVMRAAEEWHTEKSNSWLEQLDAEQDNLRAALAWNLAHQPHEALRMAVAVAPFWEARGRFREALGALDSTLNGALNGTTGDQDALAQTRVRAHSSAAHLAFLVGDLASARTHVDSALPLARQNGDKRSELHALRHHALIKINEGDVAGALTHRDSMRALSEQIGEPRVWAEVLFILGSALVAMRDAHVVPLAEECMQLFTALEDRLQIGMTYDLRAYARLAIDDGDGALHDWQTALEIGRECGAAYLIYKSLRQLGVLTARSGDFAQARLIMREAGEFLPQTQSAYFAAYFWECCAYIAAGEGRAAQAAQLIGAAQALRKAIGHPLLPIFLPDHEHFIARARATIGADDFEAELTVGHTLNESAAMALAWAELEIA